MQGDDSACVCPSLPPSIPHRGGSGSAVELGDLGLITTGPNSAAAPAPGRHRQTETMMVGPRLPREATNRTATFFDLQLIINLSFRV